MKDEDAVASDEGELALEGQSANAEQPSFGTDSAVAVRRLEGRLARLEAQVRANTDRLAQVDQGARIRKQRGLRIRLVLLGLALAALFYLRMRAGS